MNINSIDVETSGLDPNKHSILSIGIVNLQTKKDFYQQIRHAELLVEPGALEVNKLDLTLGRQLVLYEIIDVIQPGDDNRILGVNPQFDLSFLNKTGLGNYFSYRVIDLNSIFAFLGEGIRELITAAAKDLLYEQKPEIYALGKHHALYDAWWNVYAYEECSKYNHSNRVRL